MLTLLACRIAVTPRQSDLVATLLSSSGDHVRFDGQPRSLTLATFHHALAIVVAILYPPPVGAGHYMLTTPFAGVDVDFQGTGSGPFKQSGTDGRR